MNYDEEKERAELAASMRRWAWLDRFLCRCFCRIGVHWWEIQGDLSMSTIDRPLEARCVSCGKTARVKRLRIEIRPMDGTTPGILRNLNDEIVTPFLAKTRVPFYRGVAYTHGWPGTIEAKVVEVWP